MNNLMNYPEAEPSGYRSPQGSALNSFLRQSLGEFFRLKNPIIFTLLLLSPTLIFSQELELGILSSFEAYTGAGAATNSGTFTGDIGTNDGTVSGFIGPGFIGTIYNSDSTTAAARDELLKVYIQLCDVFVTHPGTHAPAFGSGEVITPGVYSIGGAGSVTGMLTLDGGGDSDAVFIIKFEGAFTAAASSIILLSNGTRACNVFWIAEGVIAVGANSIIKGTLLAHPGAISLGLHSTIEGRMLTTEGAITIADSSVAITPQGPIAIRVLCSGSCAPTVDVLRSIEYFTFFTSDGSVVNAATSGIIGEIGTNNGSISGFGTSTHIGSTHNSNAVTAQAKIDLLFAYNQLMLLPNTQLGHAPAFGSGETLNAGVYSIGGAGSLAGTITLDGQNNPDPVFIFKFDGAFSVAAQSKVIFTNGTRLCNIFWIAEGAVTMGTFTYMKGNVIAHGGACNMAANGNLEGRLLSTIGAIGFSTGVAYNSSLCQGWYPSSFTLLPVEVLSFTATILDSEVQLDWVTATETNNDYFNVQRSTDGINFTSISKINSAYENSTETLSYSIVDDMPLEGWSYYRLKQTDYDQKVSYSNIVAIEFNKKK
jgi:hypothetical protein